MINLALIGIGEWGKNYLSTIRAFSNCRIKYICSKSLKSLGQIDDSFVKTTNYKDLLKFKDIDGVIIATPGSTHYTIAKEFLKKGFNLLIEKPLTTDYRQAVELKKLKSKTEAKVLIGHIYLFDPAYIQMKKLFKQIGSLRHVSYEAVNHGPFDSDISVLWDLGPHAVSLLLDVYEQNPVKMKAWATNSLKPNTKLFDAVYMELEFPNQNLSFVKISRLSPIKRRELIVVGRMGTLVYNDLHPDRLTLFEGKQEQFKGKDITYNHRLPLEIELGEFINWLSKKQAIIRSNLDFGVKVTYLLNLVEESILKDGEAANVKNVREI